MNLNVGCRRDLRADCLNVDIQKYSVAIDLICDAHYLPFRAKKFKIVFLIHVLEHLLKPYEALKEMKRVSSIVVIKIPNLKYFKFGSDTYGVHFYGWSPFNFENLLKKIFEDVKIYHSWRPPNAKGKYQIFLKMQIMRFLSFFISNEVTAYCR